MTNFLRPSVVALAALMAVATAAVGPALAAPLTTDAPPGPVGNAQGPAPFRFYGTGGSHTQVVYESPFFSSFDGARSIDAIAFRSFPGASPSPFFGNTLTLSNVIIQLSTTSRGDEGPGVLSPTFASNIGADVTTVYSGPLTITTTVPGTFDYLVTFQTPFIYNPALGNLLLDVLVPVSATASGPGFGFLTFDNANTLNDGVFSIVSISDGGATTGFAGTDGAIARFFSSQVGGPVSVPEPASFMMLAFGAAMLGLVARRGGTTLRA